MLVIGNERCIPPPEYGFNVFNLFSLREGLPKIHLGPSSMNQAVIFSQEYDAAYMKLIFENDLLFFELMSIVMPLYNNEDVYLVYDDSLEFFEELTELIVKIIQQRYGYNYIKINDISDILYIDVLSFSFSFNGVYNLDIDKERYARIAMMYHPGDVMEVSNGEQVIREGLLYYKRT